MGYGKVLHLVANFDIAKTVQLEGCSWNGHMTRVRFCYEFQICRSISKFDVTIIMIVDETNVFVENINPSHLSPNGQKRVQWWKKSFRNILLGVKDLRLQLTTKLQISMRRITLLTTTPHLSGLLVVKNSVRYAPKDFS